MPYSSENYLEAFGLADNQQERFENLRHKGVFRYRVKTFKCGNLLECEIFPLWISRNDAARAKRSKPSRLEQKNLNDKNSKKYIARLTNLNFDSRDIWFTGTFDDAHLPETDEQAHRNVANYIKRLRYRRKLLSLPELRYIYTIEGRPEKDKNGKLILRYHVHIIMSGDLGRDEIEKLWSCGARREAHRLQPDEFELTGLARYIAKAQKKGRKRWGRSQNLKIPKPTIADCKVTKRQVEKIARNESNAPTMFEKANTGYRFLDMKIQYSSFVPGAYVYVRMRKDSLKLPEKSYLKRCNADFAQAVI
ncbi:hypothetical protein [Ethanoligenens sp.]|uniref:hypothetical protein n=1 Tax=Ethanoligenens sp. TaxID=2099655 RepID=UPI0039E87417